MRSRWRRWGHAVIMVESVLLRRNRNGHGLRHNAASLPRLQKLVSFLFLRMGKGNVGTEECDRGVCRGDVRRRVGCGPDGHGPLGAWHGAGTESNRCLHVPVEQAGRADHCCIESCSRSHRDPLDGHGGWRHEDATASFLEVPAGVKVDLKPGATTSCLCSSRHLLWRATWYPLR